MDSSGIKCLIEAHEVARRRSRRIEVIAGAKLSRVIDVTGIRSTLHFIDDPVG